jgi:hypothetical protein
VISLAAPLWLTGLVLIPLLWWLHRRSSCGRSVLVASLALWPVRRPPEAAAGPTARHPVDPALLRRVLIVALAIIALAGPASPRPSGSVTVWVDDSASMRATEAGGPRSGLALARLGQELAARAAGEVIVRALGDPATARTIGELPALFAAPTAGDAGREPVLPAPESLEGTSEHWLVTDGADARVNAWLGLAPIGRVLQSGSTTENVALTALSVRRALSGAGRYVVQAAVMNAGRARAERRLELAGEAGTLWSAPLQVEPGQSATVNVELEWAAGRLQAVLSPGDALHLDDSLALDASGLAPVAVEVDSSCPAALRAAILAHPATQTAAAASRPDLAIDCAGRMTASGAPRLLARPVIDGRAVEGAARWSSAAAAGVRLALDPRLLVRSGSLPRLETGDTLLLGTADEPLVVRRAASTPVVEVALDLAQPAFAASPQYPLFVSAVAALTLERPLLGVVTAVSRPVDGARIAPLAQLTAEPQAAWRPASARDLSAGLLWAAVLLLAWDLVAASGVALATRRYYRGEVA